MLIIMLIKLIGTKNSFTKTRYCWELAASEERVQVQCVVPKPYEQNVLQKEELKNPPNVDSDKNYD